VFDRENAVGFLLLALCASIGGVMIWAIATGTRLRYTGPAWLAWALAALFIGFALFGLLRGRRGGAGGGGFGGGRAWPDPQAGQGRGGWRRWFRRGA